MPVKKSSKKLEKTSETQVKELKNLTEIDKVIDKVIDNLTLYAIAVRVDKSLKLQNDNFEDCYNSFFLKYYHRNLYENMKGLIERLNNVEVHLSTKGCILRAKKLYKEDQSFKFYNYLITNSIQILKETDLNKEQKIVLSDLERLETVLTNL